MNRKMIKKYVFGDIQKGLITDSTLFNISFINDLGRKPLISNYCKDLQMLQIICRIGHISRNKEVPTYLKRDSTLRSREKKSPNPGVYDEFAAGCKVPA